MKVAKEHLHDGRKMTLEPQTFLVISISKALVMRILSRSLFFAMVLASFHFLVYSRTSSVPSSEPVAYGSLDAELLNLMLNDFSNEGLLKDNDMALLYNSPVPNDFDNKIHVLMDSDSERKRLLAEESYDFVFTYDAIDAEFIDRILKIDGIVAFPLEAPSNSAFKEQSNYKVVDIKQHDFVIVVLKKTGPAVRLVDFDSFSKRKLLAAETKAGNKIVALEGLEDVHLEPPKKSLVKSRKYLNNIRYLPDLVGDSLEGYNRRVFISVGLHEEVKSAMEWFEKHYPKKNKKFETHSLVAESDDLFDVSTWLSNNVKEEEYVVMKAEAEVIEEMMKKKTIGLVDELFLECKNNWWQMGVVTKKKRNIRAYWECLALYGRVRDEGVAVHQWWGY
ncbi:unnamed protein product [Sphenostylis stenocarpa]|uniref:DUF7870 domain-containing protein n=1 Tax=Sphenostylis stenocarpa TaxID=92480 RepID=A0AA86SIQ8_9FABA|nr:unnamed protein product [Sphenostylis stenocarpa]